MRLARAAAAPVLVGGDYQGRNPDVQNAYRTYIGADAVDQSRTRSRMATAGR
jgi:hypothetical protein